MGYNVGRSRFSGQFFRIFEINSFYFIVAMSSLLHDVEAIHGI